MTCWECRGDILDYYIAQRKNGVRAPMCSIECAVKWGAPDAVITSMADIASEDQSDSVNHPSHYADGWSNGAEIIDITEHLNFCRGNAVKYVARAGKKDPTKELEDLKKAEFYIRREIARLESDRCP